ncbi:MAG: hypothetical protein RR549_03730 [Oscillospiraceae bacterium]
MKNKPLIITAALCCVAIIVMICALSFGGKSGFTPPPFDNNATSGAPTVPENSGYSPVKAEKAFTAYVCGKITNDKENNVWLKLRVTNENDEILTETGLLKPNEYVKTIKFATEPKDGQKIKLKIMAYEPNTYESAGTITLNTTITLGGDKK